MAKVEGTNTEQYIVQQIDELHEEIELHKKHLAELEAITAKHELADIEFDIIMQLLSTMSENIDSYSLEQKRAAIRTFIRQVVWDGENVHVYLFGNDGEYDFPNPPTLPDETAESESPLGEDSE